MKRIVVLAIAVTIFMAILVSSVSAPCPAGMVGYWKLDETVPGPVVDSYDANDGTNYGATINQPGQVGTAYSFDGVNDYVQVPENPSINIGDDFSYALWIKTTDYGASWPLPWIIDKDLPGAPTVQGDYLVWIWHGMLCFWTGASGVNHQLMSNAIITDGMWHHIVFTRERSTGLKQIFIDGVLDNSDIGPTDSLTNTENLCFGANGNGGGGGFLQGTLDEIALYDRVLSALEIWSQYYAGSAGYGYCERGPVGGVWTPINKFELLAPYIGLASLITIATISIVYVKYRKKK